MAANVFEESAALIFKVIFYAEDGDIRFLRNTGNDLPECMAKHPR
jgi:hypothetical protein